MFSTIQKRGNSYGLHIPKAMLDAVGLQENDWVELIQAENSIHIRKASVPHRTLEDRLTTFYGKPIDQILRVEQEEINWGKPEGKEQL